MEFSNKRPRPRTGAHVECRNCPCVAVLDGEFLVLSQRVDMMEVALKSAGLIDARRAKAPTETTSIEPWSDEP